MTKGTGPEVAAGTGSWDRTTPPESPLPPQYRAVEVLGRARSRVTYLAVDRQTGQNVVVKGILNPAGRESRVGLTRRLKRQMRTLSLLDHPNIAPFRSHETSAGVFMVREWLEGEPLAERLEDGVALDHAVIVMRDLAAACAAIHELGAIHGGITPQNIILRDGGQGPEAILVDLGLAPIRREERRARLEVPEADLAEARPRYLDPEGDPRADLYSIGLVACEMLARRSASYQREPMLASLSHQPQRRVRRLRNDVAPLISAVISKLLSPALTECYQSAASLLADLEQYLERTTHGEPHQGLMFTLGQLDAERFLGLAPPFVGRGKELSHLVEGLDEVQAGRGRVVLIEGESGVGKSRLVHEVTKVAEARGAVVLRGRSDKTGVTHAFLPWREATADYPELWRSHEADERHDKAERLRHVVASLSADLRQILPALAPLVPAVGGPVALDGSRHWQRHVDLVARVVLELARIEGFLVVVLDDLQWADKQSLEALRYLIGRASRVPLLLLGTYRSDEVDADHPLTRMQRGPNVRSRIAKVKLKPLAVDAIREMLVALIGEPGQAVDDATDAVVRRSGGNALLAVHSVHSLLEERVLRHREGEWMVDHSRLERQSVPASVLDVLLRRTRRISASLRSLLARAAVGGPTLTVDALVALRGDRHEVIQALAIGVRAALLEKVDDETYRFVHDKVREAFSSALDQSETIETHRRLAEYLEKRLEKGEQVLLELAMHRLAAGDESLAYEAASTAGLWAWEHHENDAGIRLLSAAIERANQVGRSDALHQLIESLGDCSARVGRFDEALKQYDRALTLLSDAVDRARIERKVGGVYFGLGDSVRSVRHLERALEQLGMRLPRRRFGLMFFIFRELVRQTIHTLLPASWSRRKRAQRSAKLREVVRIFDELARIYYFLDLPKTIAIHLRQLNVCEWIGPSVEMGMTYSAHGVVCATVGMLDRALTYQQEGLEIREELGDTWGIGQSHCFLGVVRYSRCELDEAVEQCVKGRKLLQGLGDQWEIETVTYHLLLCHVRAGRLASARDEAEQLLELSREIRDAKFEALALGELARLDALRGDVLLGLRVVEDAVHTSPDALSVVLAMGQKGHIYLQSGDYINARKVLEEGWEMAERHRLIQDYTVMIATGLAEAVVMEAIEALRPGQRLSGATLRRCKRLCKQAVKFGKRFPGHAAAAYRARALLEAGRDRARAAMADFTASADAAERSGARLELARTEEALGRALSEMANPKARRHIDRARHLYEEMGAWGHRARLSDMISPAETAPTAAAATNLGDAAQAVFLVEMARTLASTLDLDKLLASLATMALDHVGVDRVAIYLPSGEGPVALRMSRGASATGAAEPDVVRLAWEGGRTINAAPNRDPTSGEMSPAVLAVPIPHRDELVGVLYLTRSQGSAFQPEDQNLMEIMAAQAGMSIANATAFLTIGRLNRNLERKVFEVAQRTTELEASRAALAEQARGLEQEVDKRTESLSHTIAELEKANRLKREFLATVSHELRTPMNAIIGFTELVLEDAGDIDEEHRDSLNRVLSNAQHLMSLLEELLDLSRIERGRLELELESVELASLLDSVATSVGPLFSAKEGVTFHRDFGRLPPSIVTDPRRLGQILFNLLTNAAKFTHQGSVTLGVRQQGSDIVFEVTDTGIGIHPDHHEAVFEKFRQIDGSIARRRPGLGLGLSLSRELARLLEGDIEVESEEGKGSTFRVRHPLDKKGQKFDRSPTLP